MTWFLVIALYFGIPALALWISGRQYTWQGIFLLIVLWPIAWLFMGPEELP